MIGLEQGNLIAGKMALWVVKVKLGGRLKDWILGGD